MNTAVVNIKIDAKTKKEAQAVAEELGISLSSIIKAYLRQLVRTKRLILSTQEEPTRFMLNALKQSKKEAKAGKVISFNNTDKAIAYFKNLPS